MSTDKYKRHSRAICYSTLWLWLWHIYLYFVCGKMHIVRYTVVHRELALCWTGDSYNLVFFILKVYFPSQATLVQFSPHCVHGRWINIAGYTQTVNTCSETLYTNDCLRPPACQLARHPIHTALHCFTEILTYGACHTSYAKIAIKSITSSCWLKLFSWKKL